MFHQQIDPAQAEKLMPEHLQQVVTRSANRADSPPGVLRLLHELTLSNLFSSTE